MTENTDRTATIRELTIARGRRLQPVHIVPDDELRDSLAEAQAAIDELQQAKDFIDQRDTDTETADGFLADEPKDYDALLAEATAARDALEAEAIDKGLVLAVNFRRLNPDDYQKVIDAAVEHVRETAEKDPIIPMGARVENEVGRRLVPLCYASATGPDGTDAGFTLDELKADVLDHADMERIEHHCIIINRTGQAVDFHRANSGSPTTS